MATAKDCRDHATECERLAGETKDSMVKQSYLQLAKTWHGMAEKLERLDDAVPQRERGGD